MKKLNIKLSLCLIFIILTSVSNALANHFLYINGSNNNEIRAIEICQINPDTGGFSECNTYPDSIIHNARRYDAMAINPTTKKIYLASSLQERHFFSVCKTRDDNGEMFDCQINAREINGYSVPIQGIAFSHSGTRLYFTKDSSNRVYGCDIDIHSDIDPFPTNCKAMNRADHTRDLNYSIASGHDLLVRHQDKITISNDDSWAFISDMDDRKIVACHILGKKFDHCNVIKNDEFSSPSSIAMDPKNNDSVYVLDKDSHHGVVSCAMSVESNLMHFKYCSSYPSAYELGKEIIVDPTGTYAYMRFINEKNITISRLANASFYYVNESSSPGDLYINSMAFR